MKEPDADGADVTLQNLRTVLEFARTEHLGTTAEALDLSPAAVQRSLRAIEQRLGIPIVRRDGRNLRLLHAGRVLADQAARVLRTRDEALDAVLVAAGRARDVVRRGYLFSLSTQVMPELVARVKLREPQTRVELHLGSTAELVGRVLAGELDAACLAPIPELSEIATRPLFTESMQLCVQRDDPLAKRRDVDLRLVRDREFVTLREGFGTRAYLLEACARSGFRPLISYEVDDIFSAAGIVGAGLAVSVLPSSMRDYGHPGVAYVDLAAGCATQRTVGLAYRRTAKPHRALAALIAATEEWAP